MVRRTVLRLRGKQNLAFAIDVPGSHAHYHGRQKAVGTDLARLCFMRYDLMRYLVTPCLSIARATS